MLEFANVKLKKPLIITNNHFIKCYLKFISKFAASVVAIGKFSSESY